MSSKAFNNVIKLNDIIDVKDYGAAGDGVSDDTLAIQAAINAANGREILLGKQHLISNTLAANSGIFLTGRNTTIVLNDATVPALKVFPEIVSRTTISAQSTAAIAGTTYVTTFTVSSAANITTGTICKVFSQDSASWDATVWRSETFCVLKVSGTTVFADRILYHTYTTSPELAVLSAEQVSLKGVRFTASADPHNASVVNRYLSAVEILGAVNPQVDASFENTWGGGVFLYGCFGGRVVANVRSLPDIPAAGAFGYGVAIYGGGFGTQVSVRGSGCRHAVTGESFKSVSAPSYSTSDSIMRYGAACDVTVQDSFINGNFGNAAFDTHASCINWRFVNCHTTQSTPGPNLSYSERSCGFQNRGFGTTIMSSSVIGCEHGIKELSTSTDFSSVLQPTQSASPPTHKPSRTVISSARISECEYAIKSTDGTSVVGTFVCTDLTVDNCSFVLLQGTADVKCTFTDSVFLSCLVGFRTKQDSSSTAFDVRYVNCTIDYEAVSPAAWVSAVANGPTKTTAGTVSLSNVYAIGALNVARWQSSDSSGTLTLNIDGLTASGTITLSGTGTIAINRREILTGTASPSGVVTPPYFGVLFFDTAGENFYLSTGTTNTKWKIIT